MTTLPEAIAALDAIGCCSDSACLFAASRGGMRTQGGCAALKTVHDPEELARVRALAAVVKAARERVAQDEREAKLKSAPRVCQCFEQGARNCVCGAPT